jgi:Malonate decarboxylase delta subunit (MdcD).
VVASGDLEVIFRPTDSDETVVSIVTGSDGFKEVWKNVLDRFLQDTQSKQILRSMISVQRPVS